MIPCIEKPSPKTNTKFTFSLMSQPGSRQGWQKKSINIFSFFEKYIQTKESPS